MQTFRTTLPFEETLPPNRLVCGEATIRARRGTWRIEQIEIYASIDGGQSRRIRIDDPCRKLDDEFARIAGVLRARRAEDIEARLVAANPEVHAAA